MVAVECCVDQLHIKSSTLTNWDKALSLHSRVQEGMRPVETTQVDDAKVCSCLVSLQTRKMSSMLLKCTGEAVCIHFTCHKRLEELQGNCIVLRYTNSL